MYVSHLRVGRWLHVIVTHAPLFGFILVVLVSHGNHLQDGIAMCVVKKPTSYEPFTLTPLRQPPAEKNKNVSSVASTTVLEPSTLMPPTDKNVSSEPFTLEASRGEMDGQSIIALSNSMHE